MMMAIMRDEIEDTRQGKIIICVCNFSFNHLTDNTFIIQESKISKGQGDSIAFMNPNLHSQAYNIIGDNDAVALMSILMCSEAAVVAELGFDVILPNTSRFWQAPSTG